MSWKTPLRQPGRGYLRTDLEAIGTFGVSSGLISVLVLVLYVMSPEVRILYQKPTLLLLLCPLFLYWITRLWFKANRGEVPQTRRLRANRPDELRCRRFCGACPLRSHDLIFGGRGNAANRQHLQACDQRAD